MPRALWVWIEDRGSIPGLLRPLFRLAWPRAHFCYELDGLFVIGSVGDWRCECVEWPMAWGVQDLGEFREPPF